MSASGSRLEIAVLFQPLRRYAVAHRFWNSSCGCYLSPYKPMAADFRQVRPWAGGIMKAVLGGVLENALIRQMTLDFDPRRLGTTHGYYRSLQRSSEPSAFNRAATVLSIADSVLLPEIDWTSGMISDQAPPIESLGWEPFNGEEIWKEDWVAFAEIAIEAGAFAGSALRSLSDVPSVQGNDDTAEDYRSFSVHHVMRLLLQLDAAEKQSALLFLPEGDGEVLAQLSTFAKSSPHRHPLDLPDLDPARHSSEDRSVTLLAFSPPDTSSIIPVRKDAGVRK